VTEACVVFHHGRARGASFAPHDIREGTLQYRGTIIRPNAGAAEKTRGETICVNTFFDRNRGVQIRPRKLRVRARQSIGEIVLRC